MKSSNVGGGVGPEEAVAVARAVSALNALQCLEVVKYEQIGVTVSFTCRFFDKSRWKKIAEYALKNEVGRGWSSFLGERWLLHPTLGTLVSAVHISLKSADLVASLPLFSALLLNGAVVADGGTPDEEGAGIADFEVVGPPVGMKQKVITDVEGNEVIKAPFLGRPDRNDPRRPGRQGFKGRGAQSVTRAKIGAQADQAE